MDIGNETKSCKHKWANVNKTKGWLLGHVDLDGVVVVQVVALASQANVSVVMTADGYHMVTTKQVER